MPSGTGWRTQRPPALREAEGGQPALALAYLWCCPDLLASLSKGKVRSQTPLCPHKPSSQHTHTRTRTHGHTHAHAHACARAWNWIPKQQQALEIVPRDPYTPGLSKHEPVPGGCTESTNRKAQGDQPVSGMVRRTFHHMPFL